MATRWGVYRTRRLNAKGVPECAGMDPAYLFTRYRDANGIDWALAPATGASDADIDPDAISSYRRLVARFGGDDELAQLSDDAFVRSLGFHDDSAEPVKLGAIALFGTPEAIARHLPYHQLVVVDRRGPAATHRSASPLAPMVEGLAGLEALPLVLNALMHRDYTLPGAVYVRLEQTRTNVTSPGGMARGPRSRAPGLPLARARGCAGWTWITPVPTSRAFRPHYGNSSGKTSGWHWTRCSLATGSRAATSLPRPV